MTNILGEGGVQKLIELVQTELLELENRVAYLESVVVADNNEATEM